MSVSLSEPSHKLLDDSIIHLTKRQLEAFKAACTKKLRKTNAKQVAKGIVNLFDTMQSLLGVSAQEEKRESHITSSATDVYEKMENVMEKICNSSCVARVHAKRSGNKVMGRQLNKAKDSFCELSDGTDRVDRFVRDQILLEHFTDILKATRDMTNKVLKKVIKKVKRTCKKERWGNERKAENKRERNKKAKSNF